MGVSLAGFQSRSVVKWDRWACDTVRQNQQLGHPLVRDWPVVEGDVRQWIKDFDVESLSLAVWIWLRVGRRVNPSQWEASTRHIKTHAICFPPLWKSSVTSGLALLSWRTSRA